MPFNIAKERPFHTQISINNVVSVLAIAFIPLVDGHAVFGTPPHIALTVAATIAWLVLVNVTNEKAYRITSHISMFFVAMGLRFDLDAGELSLYWRAFIAAVVLMAVAVLFVRTIDYLLGAFVAICVFYAGVDGSYFQTIGYPNLVLAMACTISVGCMMNIIVMKSYREAYEAKEEYKRLSQIDPMTGLSNRRAFMDKLSSALQNHTDNSVWLAILDLDHFKLINDRHGHDMGDMVLIAIADCLKKHFPHGMAARLGGEEFAVILVEKTEHAALALMERFLQEIRDLRVSNLSFTFSAGLAQSCQAEDILSLLKRTDHALYKAKENGRNRIEMADYVDLVETELTGMPDHARRSFRP